MVNLSPGRIALIGSGETAPGSGQIFELVVEKFRDDLKIGILETPAGFELNSQQVAQRVADFLQVRLQNYHPEIHVIPARKRGTRFSPDQKEILDPMIDSSLFYMGAGSPSYAVRQLMGSLAWNIIRARHRMGASLAFASAATVAIGKYALPVYEIFKVGEDPHWKPGLDFFNPFGLEIVIVPHWNNQEGGSDLDTSRCFIGRKRFEALTAQLDPSLTILGLDEHTSLYIDLENRNCQVVGRESVHVIREGKKEKIKHGNTFSIFELGPFMIPEDLENGIPQNIWATIRQIMDRKSGVKILVPDHIQELIRLRQSAREESLWSQADELRKQIANMGWEIVDTPQGPQLFPQVKK